MNLLISKSTVVIIFAPSKLQQCFWGLFTDKIIYVIAHANCFHLKISQNILVDGFLRWLVGLKHYRYFRYQPCLDKCNIYQVILLIHESSMRVNFEVFCFCSINSIFFNVETFYWKYEIIFFIQFLISAAAKSCFVLKSSLVVVLLIDEFSICFL